MNINKYIELLRFYLTDKINTTEISLQETFSDQISEIISSILSAIFSLFLSQELIDLHGFWGIFLKIILIIISYFLLRIIIKKASHYLKLRRSINNSDKRNLSHERAKLLIDKFDHIACDGVLLSKEYLNKYASMPLDAETNERLFYLFEAFYYYKKSIELTTLITEYANICLNSINNVNRISLYRFHNIYSLLLEVNSQIKANTNSEKDIPQKEEFLGEINNAELNLKKITEYVKTKITE